MNRHEFFVKRLSELGMFDETSDYNGMIGKCVEELSLTFANQGHSGSSAIITIELFDQLMKEWDAQGWVSPEVDSNGLVQPTHPSITEIRERTEHQ